MTAEIGFPGYLRFPHLVGEQLVFAAADDVWLAPADGGVAARLTSDASPVLRPRLSADAQTLAWVSRRAGEPEVFTMPLSGGVPRQLSYFGHPGTTLHGFARDGRLVAMSAGLDAFRSRSWGWAFDLAEEHPAPARLPYGPITGLAEADFGAVVVGTGYLRDPAHWKRYRGGTAGRLWLDATGSGEFAELLPDTVGPKTAPVWIGDRLAFLGDFEGHGNVYSVAADGTDLRRHTDHDQFYARQLTGDGTRLVYQHGGRLWRLDDLSADSQPRQLDVRLTGSRAGRARRAIEAARHVGQVSVDRTGRGSAIEVRGSIVWLPHRGGPARLIAHADGVRHREPAVLAAPTDAPAAVACVSDVGGDDAVEIISGDGHRRHFGTGQLGRVLELVASPDGRRLALATHDGRVLLVQLSDTGEQIIELASNPNGDSSGLAFSPDSAWLAFSSVQAEESLRSIRLVELSSGAVHEVTGPRFNDSDPVFSPDGKYLYFLSARTFDPVYDAHVFDLSFPLATRPYLVTLAATTPSPFEPELLGEAVTGGGTATGEEIPGADKENSAANSAADAADAADSTDRTDRTERVIVDLDGLADRIVPFPVAAGRLGNLKAARGGVIWTDTPVAGELGESRNPDDDIRPSVQRWDFLARKQIRLLERADSIAISSDGTRLVVRDKESIMVVPADHAPAESGDDTIEVDTSRIRIEIDPPAEWRQMLDETARLMRDHFWVPDMAGVDWDREVDKYRPLLDLLGSRDDLSDLLWEVNGETGSSHAYENPPPPKPDPATRPAFLGADLFRDAEGRWRIERIIAGDSSARDARSPLQAPGVSAAVGDVVLAVNGVAVRRGSAGVGPLLLGTADKPVHLELAAAVDGPGGVDGPRRSVVVRPLASETQLRYLDWVASRRARVHAESGGRIGYVHVPDMVSTGWAAFHRDLVIEMARDALIVDTRDNNGGHTSQLVIEKLARKVLGWDTSRHRAAEAYPGLAPRGPLLSLANEWSGSDGDIVNAAFQALELGPVIGRRTWGGVIGIDGRYTLVDGTSVTQPRFSFWFERFGWGVENYGVDPDQVVEFPPQDWVAGADPQLQAGIAHLLAELAGRPPAPRPDLAARPSRRAPQLPPRP
ncbi:PDZ domain-containing protein [Jatrophihabitans telluris]|uniref:Tricorn protease homolog n=1 Tax=Jatrophihabitans telluris TaxID=2038343 RepID=A0ABY4QW57_9ACTN|nr:S41 family peptidase [Jatrophihabitans telluris]UQX87730.1 PDZ domain-containing protein [Jatrophihabitans telluris]